MCVSAQLGFFSETNYLLKFDFRQSFSCVKCRENNNQSWRGKRTRLDIFLKNLNGKPNISLQSFIQSKPLNHPQMVFFPMFHVILWFDCGSGTYSDLLVVVPKPNGTFHFFEYFFYYYLALNFKPCIYFRIRQPNHSTVPATLQPSITF